MKTMKARYQALQDEVMDRCCSTNWGDILESVEGHLDVDIFGVADMQLFGYQTAQAACHGELVIP